ncbi:MULTISPECIES: hypothetical protein [Agrobacterium]|uniref:hypothetical protein n=1 Tax=Agrobacterium TaxID=357 RepID=UPI0015736213|nr:MULTISPECIES: hypothetical protein [Agrobacterium]MCD4659426.1 hypothetical protein [Agrobacterium sp.]NTE54376.1 hypothetical protein [Agrobacterium tumefaciens]NTE70541.1 hypothetical protein [Agrobacterium tumefaciens]
MSDQAPERAHVLVMTLSADTAEELAAELSRFGDLILQGKVTTGVMGGPASGSTYSYTVRPEQTHDVYFAAVAKWLEERRAAGACAVRDDAAS